MIDLSRFKVVYGERVMNAIGLDQVVYPENKYPHPDEKGCYFKPKLLAVMVINEDGNIVTICDEAWMFQFIPICKKDGV